jgi:cell division protein ZapB
LRRSVILIVVATLPLRVAPDFPIRTGPSWNRPIMDNQTAKDPQPFKLLERKIVELINLCDQLKTENRGLKVEALSWQREREQLIQKTDMARGKVEAMILRLKALEQES